MTRAETGFGRSRKSIRLQLEKSMSYWIIESEHRGCYVGGDFDKWDRVKKRAVWTPRFRWSILRTHRDVRQFMTEAAAETELVKVQAGSPSAKAYVHKVDRPV
jgi:hypothetical protein